MARWLVAAVPVVAAFGYTGVAYSENPNALWQIVHGQCVAAQQQHRKLSSPCVSVNAHGGYAVIKDQKGATQFLLIPTRRITGIESRALLAPHSVNYFADAWHTRGLVGEVLGHPMPPDMLSLAVNSELARSQNQLHIHIDCVRLDVRDALGDAAAKIGSRWMPFDIWFFGHHYRAMKVGGTTLAGHNPFKLLASGVPGAAADMGHYTLVVVGMRSGFVVLEDRADPAERDRAGGEELQDHSCALGQGR